MFARSRACDTSERSIAASMIEVVRTSAVETDRYEVGTDE